MKPGRGKWLAGGAVLVGIGIILWIGWMFREELLEPWYLSQLRGGTALEKEKAAIELGELGSVAAAPLIVNEINAKGVWEQDHVEAFAADPYVQALLGIGVQGVSELFARGEHREIRVLMAQWIARMETAERARFVPALAGALADEKRTVRGAAAEALVGLGKDALPAVPALGKALLDGKDSVSLAALTTLASLGPWAAEAAPDVAKLVARNGKGWETGVEILKAMGDGARDGVPELLAIFQGNGTHGRLRGLQILGELGSAAEPAAVRLAEVLRDGRILVRSEIPAALEKIGPGAVSAVDTLCAAMADPRDDLTAARALGSIGASALPKILELLGSKNARKRRGAVAALRAMRDVPPDVLREAIERHDDENGRERAAEVLAALAQNDPAGLEKVLADDEVAPEETARRARELWFLALAESRDIDEQANACRELVALRSRAVLPVIMKLLRSESSA
jgi:hypothetical protein